MLNFNESQPIFTYKRYAHNKSICCIVTWKYTLKSEPIFGNWKPFKNDEKCSLFHLKNSSRFQDI